MQSRKLSVGTLSHCVTVAEETGQLGEVFSNYGDVQGVNTLIERKSRMPQIRGNKGEAVVSYAEPLATLEMGYHRLSQRVNKMKIQKANHSSPIEDTEYKHNAMHVAWFLHD